MAKVSYYCSRTESGKKLCWPVEVLRTGDFTYVRGLAGRFKGREFSVVPSEVTSYVSSGYAMAPGTKDYSPEKFASEDQKRADALSKELRALDESAAARASASVRAAKRKKLLDKIAVLAALLKATVPGDIGWRWFDKDFEVAIEALRDRYYEGNFPGAARGAVDILRGVAERAKLATQRDRSGRSKARGARGTRR